MRNCFISKWFQLFKETERILCLSLVRQRSCHENNGAHSAPKIVYKYRYKREEFKCQSTNVTLNWQNWISWSWSNSDLLLYCGASLSYVSQIWLVCFCPCYKSEDLLPTISVVVSNIATEILTTGHHNVIFWLLLATINTFPYTTTFIDKLRL